ncbi:hypothetical protein LN474_12540, partial [Xanthomonas codiaei]|uniref:hypothetical protein n=1 Tax=Xanthomonas codiaei TaxID=56463 RepID=UPI001E4E3726
LPPALPHQLRMPAARSLRQCPPDPNLLPPLPDVLETQAERFMQTLEVLAGSAGNGKWAARWAGRAAFSGQLT